MATWKLTPSYFSASNLIRSATLGSSVEISLTSFLIVASSFAPSAMRAPATAAGPSSRTTDMPPSLFFNSTVFSTTSRMSLSNCLAISCLSPSCSLESKILSKFTL